MTEKPNEGAARARARLLLIALVAGSTPAAAADITITDSQVYDPATMAGMGLIVDGAGAELFIGADDTVTTLVDLRNGGTVDNAGLITRTGVGNRGVVGGLGSVVNHDGGQIIAADATGILLYDGGTVENRGDGSLISGGFRGVSIQGGSGSVDNLDGAVIESLGDNAVYIDATVIVTNGVGSVMTGAASGIWGTGASHVTVWNGGTVEGLAYDGISIGDGFVTNSGSGALVRASATAVFVDGTGEVINEDGAALEADSDGVVMNWGGNVTNRGGATIEAGNVGVTIADFGTLTNSGEGTRIAATGGSAGVLFINYDVDIDDAHALVNEGGASIVGGKFGVEFSLDAGGSVSNAGGSTISGVQYGIYAGGDRVTVANSGEGSLIETTGAGILTRYTVFLARGGEVINTDGARIVGASSDNGIGIYLYDPDYVADQAPALSASVVNGAGSSVTGSVTAIHSLVNATVDNAGLLDGNVWLLDKAVNTVTLHTGSSITGELFIGHNAASSLTLAGSGEQLYSQAVEGPTSFTANFVKTGTGTWILDTDIESKTVSVESGALVVGVQGVGSVIGNVTVDAGAAVGGSGVIRGDVANEGAVSPGNSPGVLTIEGEYLQKAGAVLEIEIDPLNVLSDRLDVIAVGGLGGTATIEAGAILDIARLSNQAYALGTRYTVLTTENGLFGEAAAEPAFVLTGDLTPSAFLTLQDEYDSHNAYVVVRQSQALASAAIGPNQTAVATALDTLPDTGPLRNLALNAPDPTAAQAMFDALSGEIHADVKGALVEDSRLVREAANRRIRSAFDAGVDRTEAGGVVIWGEALAMRAETDGTGSLAGFDRSSAFFVAGADAPVGDWRIGFLGGYRHSSHHVDDRASSGSGDAYDLGIYAGTQAGPLGIRTGAFYGWHEIDTRRAVVLPGLSERLSADYDAAMAQAFGELAWRVEGGRGSIEPFLNLAYVHLATGGISETGGAAALTGAKSTTGNAFSTFGARVSTRFATDGANVALHGMLGWQHAYGEVMPISTVAFDSGASFDISGVPIARDALLVETGLDVSMSPNATLGASYMGQVANHARSHAFKIRFDLAF